MDIILKNGGNFNKNPEPKKALKKAEHIEEESGAYRKILTFPWVPSIIILGAIEKSEDGDSSSASGG